MSILKGIVPDDIDAQIDKALEGKDDIKLANLAEGKYVDKEKADRLSKELKQLKSDKAVVDKELSELKGKGMTAEEKVKEALASADEAKKQYAVSLNRLKAEKILTAAGLKDEDYSDLLDGLVSDDEESTLAKVNSISSFLTKQKKETEKSIKTELLKKTPAPSGSTGEGSGNEGDSIGAKLAKQAAEATKGAQEARAQFFN